MVNIQREQREAVGETDRGQRFGDGPQLLVEISPAGPAQGRESFH